MRYEQIRRKLEESCPGAIVGGDPDAPQPYLEIAPMDMGEVASVMREELGFDRLLVVAGVDWEGYDENGKGKHREISQYEEDGSVRPAGAEGTGELGACYHLEAFDRRERFVLKTRVPRDEPEIASTAHVWPTAGWHEREAYDMYGIAFVDHPDLRRLLLPEDWEGWPLRKDYEMPKSWQSVPLEGLPLSVRETKGEGE
jgi:NADH-quinone oxidoreductase subunit C